MDTMPFYSPLRYPGGKRRLANFIKMIIYSNNLLDGEYVEPYTGGASIALSLLYEEFVRKVYINDLDKSVYSFWYSVLNHTEDLCKLIIDTPVTIDVWNRQQKIQSDVDATCLELGFSTFFLNRANRSGIISGGVIGGKGQSGKWKLDARFNKKDLISRIKKVARYKNRILLYNKDALDFLDLIVPKLSQKALIYLDPPYFVKGQQLLYTNFYQPSDHKKVADFVSQLDRYWVISYDNVPDIHSLYDQFTKLDYSLSYSAQERYQGSEIMFFCDKLEVPIVNNPAKITTKEFQEVNSL
jgi:DNA adenine methylase